VREGKLTAEQAHKSPVSNVILQALGASGVVAPAIWSDPLALAPEDVIVLCSDGLTGVVSDAVIAASAGSLPPIEACEALIDRAIAAGAPDNVSVGVFRMVSAAQQRDNSGGKSTNTTRRLGPAEEDDQSSAQTRKLKLAH
jgi:protein phosphatase